jgi:hypothetical protein
VVVVVAEPAPTPESIVVDVVDVVVVVKQLGDIALVGAAETIAARMPSAITTAAAALDDRRAKRIMAAPQTTAITAAITIDIDPAPVSGNVHLIGVRL